MSRYWKFIIAIVAAVTGLITVLVAHGWLGDYGPVVLMFLAAFGVLLKANTPPGPQTPEEIL